MPSKLMAPKKGDRAELRYRLQWREWIGLHGACGTVLGMMRGVRVGALKAPTNVIVMIDGEYRPRCVPWGNVWREGG